MAWLQAFPTDGTLISQSVSQIQDNWLYIQNTMQVDHYFADALSSNDGHHKFVNLPTGVDQAVSLTGVIYQKVNSAANPRLYYRAKTGAGVTRSPEQIATAITGTILLPNTQTTVTIVDFAGKPAFHGRIIGSNTTRANYFTGDLYFDGTTLLLINGTRAGAVSTLFANGSRLRCTKPLAATTTLLYTVIKAEV